MRTVTLLSFLAATALVGTASGPAPAFANSTAATQTAEYTPVFYADLEQSLEWVDSKGAAILKTGVYQFTLDPLTSFKPMSAQSLTRTVTHGGVYADGQFHYLNGWVQSGNINMTFNSMSTDTWRVVNSSGHYTPTLTIATNMAHDYATGITWAVSPEISGSIASGKYWLRSVDLETGNFTNVAELGSLNFTAIACDAHGQLWGIAREAIFPFRASLYKIDKTNGQTTLVGSTGYNQKTTYSGAVFDLRTGRLYWTAVVFTYNDRYEESYTSHIFEVNLSTGAATPVKTFDYLEGAASLFMIDNHPSAPDAPTDAAFTFSQGSTTNGTLSCTVPNHTYSAYDIQGALSASIKVDGTETATATALQPGETFTTQAIDLPTGNHTIAITFTDTEGRTSLPAKLTVYSGHDLPSAPQNVRITLNDDATEATITWDAPTVGKNGGYIDPTEITYTVRRRPEGINVAAGISELSFTDQVDREMGITQYEITPSVPQGIGTAVYSDLAVVGQPRTVPYLETFDSSTAYMSYIQVDANGDMSETGNCWLYYPDYREAVYWVDYNNMRPADDWMISPGITLSTDRAYRLSFSTHGYGSANSSKTTFEVYAGPKPEISALNHLILRESFTALQTGRIASTVFRPQEGDYRFGFRAINDGTDHIGLDNIRIIDYGPVTIPTEVTDVRTYRTDDGRIAVECKAPLTAMDGNNLTSLTAIMMARASDGQIIATLNNPTPGATVTLYDSEARLGINEYILVARNASGTGIEGYAMYNNMPPVPQPIENLKILALGNDALLTWQYDPDMLGTDGRVIDAEDLHYRISRRGRTGDNIEIASSHSGNSYADKDLDLALGSSQQLLTYSVQAFTEGGSAAAVEAKEIVGRTLDLPYQNKFDDYNNQWFNRTGYQWYIRTQGYDPIVRSGVDDNYLLTFMGKSGEALTSPRLNLSSLLNPRLSFWMYGTTNTTYNRGYVRLAIERVDSEGNVKPLEYLPGQYSMAADTDGWHEITVDLSDYSQYESASIVFTPYLYSKGYIHIDNVTVTGDRPAHDMRITSIGGASRAVAGRDNLYTVTVHNNGNNPCTQAQVAFSADGTALESKQISLEAGESQEVQFEYHPEIITVGDIVELTATVTAPTDDNTTNNTSTYRVEVTAPVLPYVNTLRAQSTPDKAILEWDEANEYPMSLSVTENFDNYADFSIDNIGPWKVVDLDAAITMDGISSSTETFKWTNSGKPQAFIVFNPSTALVADLAKPYSGKKCLVSFASAAPRNDDWLISPLLHSAKQTISFYARAMHPYYNHETIEILTSTSGNDPEDFTNTVTSIDVTATSWHRYTAEIPAGTTYFAIRCVSSNQFGLMLDDIEYVPAQEPVELWGYNVYRDNQRIATELGDIYYEDTEGEADQLHHYNVTAVYSSGESLPSNTVRAGRGEFAAIDTVGSDTEAIAIGVLQGIITVEGAQGQMLSICDATGRMLYSFRATASERLRVAPGIYIVRAGNNAKKVSVK